jgi:hypothetical protein
MVTLHFRAVIEMNGINPFVLVRATLAAHLRKGWRKPMPVLVRVNGQPERPWRINLMPVGDGSFYLYLHGHVRKASRTQAGDAVTVELEFDEAYQNGPVHSMPSWFCTALDKNPRALKAWEALIPSRKKELLRYFVGLKSAEAQARNLERAIHVLAGGKARFMGRAWNEE